MHNNIMAAGSKDRPPMLGPGRYSQWRSRFLRYIDTKINGEGLKKCILNGPYVPTSVLIQAVPAAINYKKQLDNEDFQEIGSMSAFKNSVTPLNPTQENLFKTSIVERAQHNSGVIKQGANQRRILNTVCLTIVPTGKTFASSTTKVESEPPNGSNADITNQCESKQALNVSAGLVPQGQKASDYDNSDPVPPRQNVVPSAEKTDSSQQGLEFLFSPLLEEYYNFQHTVLS
ncbi:hypothetical protein Tco_1030621 [Tanacetum coccineum]|uniref:Uncharacterized protein n=1 Tax=Tanacetum coccineum TaxID=301880 RepID=A0ABQ5G784_9ASTR